MLFGLAPMLWTNQRLPGDVLKEGSRGSGVGRSMRRWGALVVCEVALALLLVARRRVAGPIVPAACRRSIPGSIPMVC